MMTLKEHIDDIRSGLEKEIYIDEAAVSQHIVLRLLKALAWPISNTQIVHPEYSVGGGRVDFALCPPESRPVVFIEVKQVEKLEGAEEQLFVYVLDYVLNYDKVIPIAALTDGQKWRFFHPMGVKRCKEQKVRELDLIKDKSEKIACCLNRYLNYESIRTGEAVETIQVDYDQIVQQKRVVTWSKLKKHVPIEFHTIPPKLLRVFVLPNGEDNKVFLKAPWKVACIRWWSEWKEPVPSWENVEEMIWSTQFSLERILESDVYKRCVKYLMQTTRSAEEFRKWEKNYRKMPKRLGWRVGLPPEQVEQIVDEVKKEHNRTTREDNKDAENRHT